MVPGFGGFLPSKKSRKLREPVYFEFLIEYL